MIVMYIIYKVIVITAMATKRYVIIRRATGSKDQHFQIATLSIIWNSPNLLDSPCPLIVFNY